jgi:hypothetical protein
MVNGEPFAENCYAAYILQRVVHAAVYLLATEKSTTGLHP